MNLLPKFLSKEQLKSDLCISVLHAKKFLFIPFLRIHFRKLFAPDFV